MAVQPLSILTDPLLYATLVMREELRPVSRTVNPIATITAMASPIVSINSSPDSSILPPNSEPHQPLFLPSSGSPSPLNRRARRAILSTSLRSRGSEQFPNASPPTPASLSGLSSDDEWVWDLFKSRPVSKRPLASESSHTSTAIFSAAPPSPSKVMKARQLRSKPFIFIHVYY